MDFRLGSIAVLAMAICNASAQADPDSVFAPDGKRLTKSEERKKFHPVAVKGTAAADRKRAYADRLNRESASPFQGVKWRNIGPESQGGRIVQILAPARHSDQLYVAYATGGLYRTEDEGATWTSLFENQASFGIGAFALDKEGKTIWVGTGEANSQRTSYAGDGIYKSTDSGKTWQNMGLPESQHIGRIVIDPQDENTVYVAALGHLYSQNPERGVYKTTDGGKSWRQILKLDEYTGCIDIALDPRNPKVLVASMWDRDRRAWNFRESGVKSGVFRTENGGETWAPVTGLPVGDAAGRTGLCAAPSKAGRLYALVDDQGDNADWPNEDEYVPSGKLTPRRFLRLTDETLWKLDPKPLTDFLKLHPAGDQKTEDVLTKIKDKKLGVKELREQIEAKAPNLFDPGTTGGEVFRSDDFGKTWRRTDNGRLGDFGGYYWGEVWVDPKDADDLYVMGVPLLRSQDAGKSWHIVAETAHVDFHAVWNNPEHPNQTWIGSDGGLFRSLDGGEHTRPVNNLPVGLTTTLALDNKSPYNVYTGLQDNGTMKGPAREHRDNDDPLRWSSLFGGDGSAVAIDPRNDGDVVYLAYQFGEHFAKNQKTNEFWRARAEPPKDDPAPRYNWISPLVVSDHQNDVIYLGAQRLYRSFDQGRHYEPISPDLTKNRPNGNVPYSTLKDVSESPLRFGLIYAGADDGSVKMTPDGGYQWIDIPTPQPDKWVSRIVASKWDLGTVYCAQSGYREDDFNAYLWRSTDFGKTWKSIVGNLPAETINVVREDPNRKDLLYVGTDMGAYVTYDGGANWEPLPGGFPHIPVHDLQIQARAKELVAATHGRSVLVLPLQWVYGLTPEIRKADLTVFDLDDVTRRTNWGYQGQSQWETPKPADPKVKGTFYTRSPGKATVRVKDKAGKVVKELSVDATLGFNSYEIPLMLAPGGPKKPAVPTDVLADPYEASRPKYLEVGEYTVEVEVNGKKATKPLKVVAE